MAFEKLKEKAAAAKRDAIALYYAFLDRRTPWYAKLLCVAVVGYALSPLDIIPDFIPVLGMLDDLLIVPAGIALVLRLVPGAVLADCRERAAREGGDKAGGVGRVASFFVAALWLAIAVAIVWAIVR